MTISVIITTYGDENWRELAWSRAYPSVMGQLATTDEVIVHHSPSLTIGPARNAAAEQAVGDYFVFLDADDELHPEYLHAMRWALRQPAGEEITGGYLFQPAVQWVKRGRHQKPYLIPEKDLRTDNYLVVGTMLSRRLFEKVGGFEDYPHGFEDWSLWAKCWKRGARVVTVPEAIYIAHVNPHSEHKKGWRNRKAQVAMHLRVQAELFPETV